MSEQISQIGEKKDDDKWAQEKKYREQLAKESEKGSEAVASEQASKVAQGGAAQVGKAAGAVQSKGDVAGISPEALSANSSLESRVNFGAWEMEQNPSGATKEGRPVAEVKDASATKNPKRAAGEAVASEAAVAAAGGGTGRVAGAGGIQVSEASGTATAKKPQTVPGVGNTKASKNSPMA